MRYGIATEGKEKFSHIKHRSHIKVKSGRLLTRENNFVSYVLFVAK